MGGRCLPCPNANDKRKKMPGGINYNPLKSFNMFFPKKESPFENTNTSRTWARTGLDKCAKKKTKVSRRGMAAVGVAMQKPRQIA